MGAIAAFLSTQKNRESKTDVPPPRETVPRTPEQTIAHALIGRWTMPIDGRNGFIREYRSDGTATVWWPDGRIAALGKFFVVDTNTIGVEFQNHDTDVVHLTDTNTIQIDHVEFGGHRKFYARRE